MSAPPRPLTFNTVDEWAFGSARDALDLRRVPALYLPDRLGPLLELIYLVAGGFLPVAIVDGWLAANGTTRMIEAIQDNREQWISEENHSMGFIRALRNNLTGGSLLTSFLMHAQRAAREIAGLPQTVSGQFVGAMEELENNIHEHSEAPSTGILAFQAADGIFEFVAADRGIGVLNSLRGCSSYSSLSDHGRALEVAIQDGASRFGRDSGRGYGFRPLFLGLLNLYGSLRFRSGDHALLMNGNSPSQLTARLAQKPLIAGLFISVQSELSRKGRSIL
jgi:hypothetical protein